MRRVKWWHMEGCDRLMLDCAIRQIGRYFGIKWSEPSSCHLLTFHHKELVEGKPREATSTSCVEGWRVYWNIEIVWPVHLISIADGSACCFKAELVLHDTIQLSSQCFYDSYYRFGLHLVSGHTLCNLIVQSMHVWLGKMCYLCLSVSSKMEVIHYTI